MQPRLWKKGLAVAAVALFFALAALPAGDLSTGITAGEVASVQTMDVSPACQQETVTVNVEEYRADGTVVIHALSCSMAEVEQMERDLDQAADFEDICMVLASHGIISAGEARELAAAMRARAATAYPDIWDIWLPPLAVMFFSEISTTFRWGGTVRLGMTPFLRLINRFLKTNLQRGVDVLDICWGLRGSLTTRGLLGEHRMTLRPGMVVLAGFIGYGIHIPLLRHSFYGSAVMTMAAGLGEHDFDPWFPN